MEPAINEQPKRSRYRAIVSENPLPQERLEELLRKGWRLVVVESPLDPRFKYSFVRCHQERLTNPLP